MKVPIANKLKRLRTVFRTRTSSRRGSTRFLRGLERLEQRLALSGIVNGDFSVTNPVDPGYGWTTQLGTPGSNFFTGGGLYESMMVAGVPASYNNLLGSENYGVKVNTFTTNLPAGTYDVTAIIGDASVARFRTPG